MPKPFSILQGDVLEVLSQMKDESVQCIITSPPYWGLRDYGTGKWIGGSPDCEHIEKSCDTERKDIETSSGGCSSWKERSDINHQRQYLSVCKKCGAKKEDKQIGLEKTFSQFLEKMVAVFRECRRVLRQDGTCWVNMGDTYSGGGKENNEKVSDNSTHQGKKLLKKDGKDAFRNSTKHTGRKRASNIGLPSKNLCGIPWRLAFALQEDGWILRQDIIWHKPNPMPESVFDRCTKSHEYIFLLTKSPRYFYDAEAVKEKAKLGSESRYKYTFANNTEKHKQRVTGKMQNLAWNKGMREFSNSANKRSVWIITTHPYKEAHFATFPPALIRPCILAGTSAKGCCPKCGTPWVRVIETKSIQGKIIDKNPEVAVGLMERKRADGSDCSQFGKERFGDSFSKTIGWKPNCKHENLKPVPCMVLDPFSGSGTTVMEALKQGRHGIGIELNPKYVRMSLKRIDRGAGLFAKG